MDSSTGMTPRRTCLSTRPQSSRTILRKLCDQSAMERLLNLTWSLVRREMRHLTFLDLRGLQLREVPMLPIGEGDHTGEVASGAEKDPAAGRERMGTMRRRTWTTATISPRVAGAEEASRDLTALAMSVAEENLETTMALRPLETRLIVRGKTEDVAEAEEDSEDEEGATEEATGGCHSEEAEAEVVAIVVALHFVEVEEEEKAAREHSRA